MFWGMILRRKHKDRGNKWCEFIWTQSAVASQNGVNLSSGSRPSSSSTRKSLLMNFLNPSPSPGQSGTLSGTDNAHGQTRLFGQPDQALLVWMSVQKTNLVMSHGREPRAETMAKEAGRRKHCLQGAFNTSEENSLSPSLPDCILPPPHKDEW